jgi:hypothetical protein
MGRLFLENVYNVSYAPPKNPNQPVSGFFLDAGAGLVYPPESSPAMPGEVSGSQNILI